MTSSFVPYRTLGTLAFIGFLSPVIAQTKSAKQAPAKPAAATEAKPKVDPELDAVRKKAKDGDPASQLLLANAIFAGGEKVGKIEEAATYLEKASDAGHVPAQLAFARYLLMPRAGVKPDFERAKFLLQQAAEGGAAAAQTAYGLMLLSEIDMKGRDLDFSQPVLWLRKAADQNEPEALCRLGMMQATGQGMAIDPGAGLKLIQKSARLGFPLALNEMAVALQNGTGIEKDEIAAIGYYHAAADLGNAAAIVNLASCYETGRGVPQSFSSAGALYARGAKMGFAMANFGLARLFEEGLGTKKNSVFAYVNYVRAATGIPQAATKRDAIKATLSKEQLAEAQKLLTEGQAAD